jgi:hypothetical protein
LFCAIRTIASQASPKSPGLFQNVRHFVEVEQRSVIKFFVEEGMKGVEITDRLNKHYDGGALQQTPAYHCIKEGKSGRKDLSHIPPPGKAPNEDLDDCIAKALNEDPHLSTKQILKALNIGSTTVQTIRPSLCG